MKWQPIQIKASVFYSKWAAAEQNANRDSNRRSRISKRRDPEGPGNRTNVCRVGLAKRDRRGRRLQGDLQGAPGNEATEDPND